MGNTLVDYRTEAGVATIALCDPPMNAFTYEMMKDLDDAILDARFDNDVHVVVLTGYGDRFFSAGANTEMLSEVDHAFRYYFGLHASETLTRLENTAKLVIAALNGHTGFGGLEIALACDIRIARKGAGKIGFPDMGQDILPQTGGAHRLSRLVGKSRAMQLMVEGPSLDFDRALELGIVNYVWETESRDAFHARVVDYARKQLSFEKRRAIGTVKRSLKLDVDIGLEQALSLDHDPEM